MVKAITPSARSTRAEHHKSQTRQLVILNPRGVLGFLKMLFFDEIICQVRPEIPCVRFSNQLIYGCFSCRQKRLVWIREKKGALPTLLSVVSI